MSRYAEAEGQLAFDIEGIMGDHGATMGMTLCFGQGRGAHDTRDYLIEEIETARKSL